MTERFGFFAMLLRSKRVEPTGRMEMSVADAAASDGATLDQAVAETPDIKLDRAKRRQIVEGAHKVFLSQGFDAASMGSIAQTAGVSKGTLYVYFKSKEDLFGAIIEEQRQSLARQIFMFDPAEDIECVLTRFGAGFTKFLCCDVGLSSLRTVIAIANRMPEMGERFYRNGPETGLGRFTAYLDAKVAEGVLRPHDTEVAAAQFMDSCVSLIFKPLLFNAMTTPDPALIDRVVGMAVRTYLQAWKR